MDTTHIGIQSNDEGDKGARETTSNHTTILDVEIPPNDFKSHIKRHKLCNIKTTILPLPTFGNRKQQVIITRFRINHTRFTQKHLFQKTDPEICDKYNKILGQSPECKI